MEFTVKTRDDAVCVATIQRRTTEYGFDATEWESKTFGNNYQLHPQRPSAIIIWR